MEKHVQVYSLSTCSNCKSTKRLLNRCKVHYAFTDLDLLGKEERKPVLEDMKRYNPACSFPTVVIGDRVIVGFKEGEILEALGLEEIPEMHSVKKFFLKLMGLW